jgi:hypothetical protein
MAELKDEIAAYETMRADLEVKALGKWVLVHDRQLVGLFDAFELAAQKAVHDFGRGPYLIRQIGAGSISLPASVMYNFESTIRRQCAFRVAATGRSPASAVGSSI